MNDWYLKDPAGAQSGPFPAQAILQWIAAGQVTGEHSVCAAGGSQWVPLTEVPVFLGALVSARGSLASAPGYPAAPAPSARPASQPQMAAYAPTPPPADRVSQPSFQAVPS